MVCGWPRRLYPAAALGLSLAAHALLLHLPLPWTIPHPTDLQSTDIHHKDRPVAEVPTGVPVVPFPRRSPPQPSPEPVEPRVQPAPAPLPQDIAGSAVSPVVATPDHPSDTAAESSSPPTGYPSTSSPLHPPEPEDDPRSDKPAQFQQFVTGLQAQSLAVGSLAEILDPDLFGHPDQAQLFVDREGKARSPIDTYILLPRHTPTQALAHLVQPELVDTETCDLQALPLPYHEQAGGGKVYATQCGPLRQYLNLVPLHPTGTLVVFWREPPE
jgi:hypothetical protein